MHPSSSFVVTGDKKFQSSNRYDAEELRIQFGIMEKGDNYHLTPAQTLSFNPINYIYLIAAWDKEY